VTTRQTPEFLHYVIWFNSQSENFEPLAVFNTKAEADGYAESFKNNAVSFNREKLCVTITQWTWSEFCAFAQITSVKEITKCA
jgi:hypothetical protein